MKPNRTRITLDLFLLSFLSLCAVLSPRATYASGVLVFRHVLPVHDGVAPGRIDVVLLGVAWCFSLFLGHQCYRASGVVAELKRRACVPEPRSMADVIGHTTIPIPLGIAWTSVMFMPIWIAPLVNAFGKWAVMGGIVWWFVASLSVLCYVGALCAYDAETSGEKPRTMLLSAAYSLGGAAGVQLAHKALPQSKTLTEMTDSPPLSGMLVFFIAVIAALAYLS